VEDHITNVTAAVLRPQKAVFGDFTGEISATKQEFLSRKVSQSLRNNVNKS
jgi:hypothetical protein